MQIINKNLKKGEIKIRIDNADDLWYLYHIISKGDLVKGKTIRKIKIGEGEDRKIQVTKKKIFLEIETEKIDYKENQLKVLGKITQGPEDLKRGSHHSFNLEEGETITIIKEKWLSYQLDKLEEATTEKPTILICVMDREEVIFAISKRKGFEILSNIKGDVAKKEIETKEKKTFYPQIANLLIEYSGRYKIQNIILASPAFWKEDLMKEIKDSKIKEKIVLATCSSVSNNAIDEVLKRPEVKEVMKQVRMAKEIKLVQELLGQVKKGEGAYGTKEVKAAAEAGAIKTLIVTDKHVQKIREQEKYEKLDEIMKIVDQTKGKINIIASDHDGGKQLDALGGIGALLRFLIK